MAAVGGLAAPAMLLAQRRRDTYTDQGEMERAMATDAKFDSGAVYVGDVCWRDDDGSRRQVVVHVAPGGSSVTVHLADCGPSPEIMFDTRHKRGELCGHGPDVLRARRHATPEEMAFAWEKFLPHRDEYQDRCHRCYTADHSATVPS